MNPLLELSSKLNNQILELQELITFVAAFREKLSDAKEVIDLMATPRKASYTTTKIRPSHTAETIARILAASPGPLSCRNIANGAKIYGPPLSSVSPSLSRNAGKYWNQTVDPITHRYVYQLTDKGKALLPSEEE